MSRMMTPRIEKMLECAASHRENGDIRGEYAITKAAWTSAEHAKRVYPDSADAIDNAVEYAAQ